MKTFLVLVAERHYAHHRVVAQDNVEAMEIVASGEEDKYEDLNELEYSHTCGQEEWIVTEEQHND